MNKFLLSFISAVFISVSSFAAERYWVGGTGNWHDTDHWSLTSGGKGGAEIPTENDDAIFDEHSFSKENQSVKIKGDAVCHNLTFRNSETPYLLGDNNCSITYTGELIIFGTSDKLFNLYNGKIWNSNRIHNADKSSGNSDLSPLSHTCTIVQSGTNLCPGDANITLTANVVPAAGSYSYSWIPGGQTTQSITGISCGAFSVIVIDNINGDGTSCSTSPSIPCIAPFGAGFFNTQPTCFGLCNGSSQVIPTGGTPPYSYSWTIVPVQTTQTATGLCAGIVYTVVVTDANLCSFSPTVQITQPAAISPNPSQTNVACAPSCTGIATVAPTGGTPGPCGGYTYLWNTSATTPSITGLCAGGYSVTITDCNGCTATQSFTITQPPVLTASLTGQTNLLCNSVCIGTATVTAGGGTPPYSYSWNTVPSQTTATATGLCAGPYTCTVTDANSCTATATVNITQPPALTITPSQTNLNCNSVCIGTASVLVAGGTTVPCGGYSYLWSTGATTPGITGLCAGSFSVTVTDCNGCTITQSFTITQPPPLVATITAQTDLTCNASCIGTATVTAVGGTTVPCGGYSYSWSIVPTQTTSTATGLCATSYTCTVTDCNGCTDTAVVTITQPPPLTLTPSQTNPPCNGSCTGTAGVVASGGVSTCPGGYQYLWNTGATTSSIAGLCAGSYTVTVTDCNLCTATQTFTLTQPPALVLTTSQTNLLCNSVCTGVAGVSVAGGVAPYTYSWNTIPVQTTSTITALCSGTYIVTVTDNNGCTAQATVTITEPLLLTTAIIQTDPSCNGLCNGTITATPAGGTPPYSYLWNPGAFTTPTVTGLCGGTYTLIVTDANLCTDTTIVTLTDPPALLAGNTVTNVTCNGLCNGTITETPSGGTPPYSYIWLPPVGTGNLATGLCPGTYAVTVTDANGCTVQDIITITQPPLLAVSISGVTTACNVCNGQATATGSGGTTTPCPGYSYLWSDGQTTATATGLCVGNYSVTVTDCNGCTATASVTINFTVQINIVPSSTSVSCFGVCDGTATANASGGTPPYSYFWNPSGQTTITADSLCANIVYTVTVTDLAGCFNSTTVSFTEPPLLTASITAQTNASCNGDCNGTATATGGGGTPVYTYLWNTVPIQNTATATGLCAGTYTVTVTDNNGCTATQTVTITEPPAILANEIVVPASCGLFPCDGSITLAPTGGNCAPYTYTWAPPVGVGPSATGLCPGGYNVTITDCSGCTALFNIAVSNNTGPIVSASQTNDSCNASCNGTATATVTAGIPPYTYSWSTLPVQITPTATGLCAGSYTCTIGDGQVPSCSTVVVVNITEPNAILANPTITNESCGGSCDGSIILNPTGGTIVPCGGYSYLWSTGATTSSITGLCVGGYTVTITDCNFCDTTMTFNITGAPVLTVVMTSINVSCNGACDGTAWGTPSGGTPPYFFSWSTLPSQPQDTAVNLCAIPGTYTLTVTDANGCTVTGSVLITEPPMLTAVLTSSIDATCFGDCDGTATVTAGGGTPGYSYLWNPTGQTTATATALCAGSYTCTVTDTNLCITTATVTITQPTQIVPNATSVDVSCNFVCDGSATSAVTGGTGPYSYLWTPIGATTPTISNLCAGTYTLTVTDFNGCTATQIVTINQPGPLLVGMSGVSPTCVSGCDGSITATPAGGTPPFSYLWTPSGQTTPTATGLCADTFVVVVTDLNGCTGSSTFILTDPPGITATIVFADATCGLIPCDGTATVTPAGGAAPYTFLWTPTGQTTPTATALCAGFYTVDVTDANGCTAQFTVGISNSTGPTVTFTNTDPLCNDSCTGTATANPVGSGPFTYLWMPGGQTTQTIIGLCAGIYSCQVTDAIGCISIDPDTIVEPSAIADNPVVTNATCNGICDGSIALTPSGGTPTPCSGYTYLWAPGGETTSSITGLCLGNYTVVITDCNGCSFTFTYNITQNTVVSASVNSFTNATCGMCNGTATAGGSGGTPPYIFQWDDPLGQTSPTATGLCAGTTYIVTVTDAIGCFGTDTITLAPANPITATSVVTDATCGVCDGQINITAAGGTAPYTYIWSNGDTTSAPDSLCAGIYQVDITDAAGCTQSFTFNVNNTNAPTGTVLTTPVSCFGAPCDGTATVTASAGTPPYTYLWIPGGQTIPNLVGMCAGNYTCQITGADGCLTNVPVTITSPSQILTNQIVVNTPCGLCNGSITLNPSGGTGPYTYLWSPGPFTTPGISNLCAGNYTVVITDFNGCTQQYIIPITSTNGPIAALTNTNVSCNGSCDGTATATVAGGTPPYSYSWNTVPVQTNNVATGLCAGSYTVTVTDAAGCSINSAITITAPPAITLTSPIAIDPLCNGDCNGVAGTLPVGGTLPYSFGWSAPGGTTNTISNLCFGTYTVDITDANGCTAQQIITLTDPPVLTVSGVVTDASCNTINDGAINITPAGGTGGYTFTWSNSATTEDISNLFAGTYSVVVTDANNCTTTATFTVNATTVVTAVASNDTAICLGDTATLCGTLSTGGGTYQWQEVLTGVTIGNASCVQVTPAMTTSYALIYCNGVCCDSDTVTVTVNPLPSANAGSDITIIIFTSGTIGSAATGGLTYFWIPGTGLNDSTIAQPTASPTVTTTYTLIVTNANGCTAIDSVTVEVLPEIVIPNGISPNGDGPNDTWVIDGIELFPNNHVEVYNRWGELLYIADGYDNTSVYWDGTYKGKDLPVGTYYYIVKLNTDMYDPDYFTGPITVLR